MIYIRYVDISVWALMSFRLCCCPFYTCCFFLQATDVQSNQHMVWPQLTKYKKTWNIHVHYTGTLSCWIGASTVHNVMSHVYTCSLTTSVGVVTLISLQFQAHVERVTRLTGDIRGRWGSDCPRWIFSALHNCTNEPKTGKKIMTLQCDAQTRQRATSIRL